MNITLDDMDLPKVNKKREKSEALLHELSVIIDTSIKDFELINNYNFQTYEIDSMFLNKVQMNHKSYLRLYLKE